MPKLAINRVQQNIERKISLGLFLQKLPKDEKWLFQKFIDFATKCVETQHQVNAGFIDINKVVKFDTWAEGMRKEFPETIKRLTENLKIYLGRK